MSPGEIEEAFRRFKEASPEPKTELKHVNPFTLLVAVVLSAQATDAGVNKATPAFVCRRRHAREDGRAREDRIRELIKTIASTATRPRTSRRCPRN